MAFQSTFLRRLAPYVYRLLSSIHSFSRVELVSRTCSSPTLRHCLATVCLVVFFFVVSHFGAHSRLAADRDHFVIVLIILRDSCRFPILSSNSVLFLLFRAASLIGWLPDSSLSCFALSSGFSGSADCRIRLCLALLSRAVSLDRLTAGFFFVLLCSLEWFPWIGWLPDSSRDSRLAVQMDLCCAVLSDSPSCFTLFCLVRFLRNLPLYL